MNREGGAMLSRLFLAISLVTISLLPHRAIAQTFACQYIEAAGLNWEAGRWKSTRFNVEKPFFLNMDGANLNQKVVADFFESTGFSSKEVRCTKRELQPIHSCIDGYGSFMFFDPRTGLGGAADLSGAITSSTGNRDSLVVKPFTCQKM
jgi:hypothetical protein